MRLFFIAIILAAIGYLGWVFFHDSRTTPPPVVEGKELPPTQLAPPAVPHTAPPPAAAPIVTNPNAGRPGVFFARERVTRQNATGIKALNPGEEVKLMYRYKDGSMLVTNGQDEFVVKPSSMTKDRPLALPAGSLQP